MCLGEAAFAAASSVETGDGGNGAHLDPPPSEKGDLSSSSHAWMGPKIQCAHRGWAEQ